MRLRLAAFLAAAALPLAGCGDDDGAGTTPAVEWDGPPVPDATGGLDVEAFNEFLAEHPESGRGPVAAATTFVRLDDASAAAKTVTAQTGGEGAGPTTVTVTLDGLFDDSVRAQRFVLVLAQGDDGSWRLDSAEATQRCHEGRGHQTFSAEPCV